MATNEAAASAAAATTAVEPEGDETELSKQVCLCVCWNARPITGNSMVLTRASTLSTHINEQEQLKLEEEKFLKLYGHKPTAKPKLRVRAPSDVCPRLLPTVELVSPLRTHPFRTLAVFPPLARWNPRPSPDPHFPRPRGLPARRPLESAPLS